MGCYRNVYITAERKPHLIRFLTCCNDVLLLEVLVVGRIVHDVVRGYGHVRGQKQIPFLYKEGVLLEADSPTKPL